MLTYEKLPPDQRSLPLIALCESDASTTKRDVTPPFLVRSAHIIPLLPHFYYRSKHYPNINFTMDINGPEGSSVGGRY